MGQRKRDREEKRQKSGACDPVLSKAPPSGTQRASPKESCAGPRNTL